MNRIAVWSKFWPATSPEKPRNTPAGYCSTAPKREVRSEHCGVVRERRGMTRYEVSGPGFGS